MLEERRSFLQAYHILSLLLRMKHMQLDGDEDSLSPDPKSCPHCLDEPEHGGVAIDP